MMVSRVDPLSWGIFIDVKKPGDDSIELWSNPSIYPEMRKVIHESIHFWHSISTYQGMRLAFDCLKSFNALRFASKTGINLCEIEPSWNFEGYKPFELLNSYSEPIGIESKLSINDLFEGLARYWDVVISAGFSFSGMIKSLIEKDSKTYSEAFRYANEIIGDVAFVLFPIFGYIALCSEKPILAFEGTLFNYKQSPFIVPRGNYQEAWLRAWDSTAEWKHLIGNPNGPMSSYKGLHERYVRWKNKYAGIIPEDSFLKGHPILEEYVQNMMALAREKWPYMSDYDREVMFLREFVLPGNPRDRLMLASRFHPPLIKFLHGDCWALPTPGFADKPDKFKESMEHFSSLMGACFGLIQRSKSVSFRNNCKQTSCSIFKLGVCSYLLNYPDNVESCKLKPILKTEFGIF